MISEHRIYPGRLMKPPRGVCHWCALLIRHPNGKVNTQKAFCGPVCKTHFDLRANPRKMRIHVFFRDEGFCSACGKKHLKLQGEWEADHVLPLVISLGDPKFWEPENVVILCKKPCHQNKTNADRRKYHKREKLRLKMRYLDFEAME